MGKVGEIEVGVAVVDHPAKREAGVGVANPEVVSAVEVGTVRIAGAHRPTKVAVAAGIDPAAAPLRPNAAAAEPSSWSRLAVAETSAPASVVMVVASRVVKVDVP